MVEIKVEILFGDFLHFELEIQHLLLGLEEKLVFVCIGDADSFSSESDPHLAHPLIVIADYLFDISVCLFEMD